MHNLGHTRSDRQPTHLLQTPDTFIRNPLPGFASVTVIVHAAPALGAAFTQYTAEFELGGSLGPAHGQRFLYVLEGTVVVALGSQTHQLGPGGLCPRARQPAAYCEGVGERPRCGDREAGGIAAERRPGARVFRPGRRRGIATAGWRPRAAGEAVVAHYAGPGLRRKHHVLPARGRTVPGRSPRDGARAVDA